MVTRRALGIQPLYRDQGLTLFFRSQSNSPPASSYNTRSFRFRRFGPSIMSGSKLQGRWMPSSVMEEDVIKLRVARYLTGEIPHRLPAQGQVIPTPKPDESVVFVSHFLRGLGFTPDPFVRGLMFYYGLDFHDLALKSILHISSFIVVCEASLRITPHFRLW